jgi:hypothetical protein
MNQPIVNFLQFKGKNLLFLSKTDGFYIAIKPVCEALGVDYIRQHKNLSSDPILGPALSKQTMQVPGDQARNMVCLPERYIYGWIFSIRSESLDLVEYKRECYDILFNHFHGAMTSRGECIREKARIRAERVGLQKSLSSDINFRRFQELIAEEARLGIAMKRFDDEALEQAADLFSSSGISVS